MWGAPSTIRVNETKRGYGGDAVMRSDNVGFSSNIMRYSEISLRLLPSLLYATVSHLRQFLRQSYMYATQSRRQLADVVPSAGIYS